MVGISAFSFVNYKKKIGFVSSQNKDFGYKHISTNMHTHKQIYLDMCMLQENESLGCAQHIKFHKTIEF